MEIAGQKHALALAHGVPAQGKVCAHQVKHPQQVAGTAEQRHALVQVLAHGEVMAPAPDKVSVHRVRLHRAITVALKHAHLVVAGVRAMNPALLVNMR